jgi:hypothetical protein
MQPEIWGKHFWFSIHFIALDYPDDPREEDILNYKTFYSELHKVLPCYKCSINYSKNLKQLPIESENLKNSKTLFKWTVDMHNIINEELHKKTVSFDDALAFYKNPKNFSSTLPIEQKFHNQTYFIMSFVFLLLFALYIFYTYNFKLINLTKKKIK